MKVVLLHDWLTGFRGGERVLEAFCELFPDAPIYTLLHTPGSCPDSIERHTIHTSFLNSVPGIGKNYRKFLPLFPLAADRLKIHEPADVVLSSSHCVIKGVAKPRGSVHVSYIHSPMRYLYDQYDVYFGPHAPVLQRWGMKVFRQPLTRWDLASNANVDHMIANSGFVAERIRRLYDIEPQIVHAFVDLKDFRSRQANPPPKENFHLMVTAFAPNKRVDLAIEAFRNSGRRLIVIGSGQEENRLKAMAGPEVSFLGSVSREDVLDHLFRARALIFPGVEDFGIVPLEAMAAGTPVVAIRAGGVLETLTDRTAEFFDRPDVEDLRRAIDKAEARSFDRQNLLTQAERFSKETFKEKIMAQVLFAMKARR